jgi:hypothetical protein
MLTTKIDTGVGETEDKLVQALMLRMLSNENRAHLSLTLLLRHKTTFYLLSSICWHNVLFLSLGQTR